VELDPEASVERRLMLVKVRADEEQHPIEKTGQALRRHFGWTQGDNDYTDGSAAR
jgi:acetolactate synthase small subunit